MCREAVWTILRRALSEPQFLEKMFRDPEKVLRSYDLSLDEKRALLSGSITDIEAYAGKTMTPLLKQLFEEATRFWKCHDVYLTVDGKN